jgi:hypothetical protein
MEKLNRWIPLLAVAGIVSGCGIFSRTYSLADVTRAQTIILKKAPGQGSIHSLRVIGDGELKGSATIVLMLNGKPENKETLSGPVHFEWGMDWYSDEVEIRYTPTSVKSGHLNLRYKFDDV